MEKVTACCDVLKSLKKKKGGYCAKYHQRLKKNSLVMTINAVKYPLRPILVDGMKVNSSCIKSISLSIGAPPSTAGERHIDNRFAYRLSQLHLW